MKIEREHGRMKNKRKLFIAMILIRHKGCLVEIGEVDWAEDEFVLDSTCGSPATNFLAKEEEQAQEAR